MEGSATLSNGGVPLMCGFEPPLTVMDGVASLVVVVVASVGTRALATEDGGSWVFSSVSTCSVVRAVS